MGAGVVAKGASDSASWSRREGGRAVDPPLSKAVGPVQVGEGDGGMVLGLERAVLEVCCWSSGCRHGERSHAGARCPPRPRFGPSWQADRQAGSPSEEWSPLGPPSVLALTALWQSHPAALRRWNTFTVKSFSFRPIFHQEARHLSHLSPCQPSSA